jgi:hypothetical protein
MDECEEIPNSIATAKFRIKDALYILSPYSFSQGEKTIQ